MGKDGFGLNGQGRFSERESWRTEAGGNGGLSCTLTLRTRSVGIHCGGFCNATPGNREYCAMLCGGSYNGIGGRTRPLFWAEQWGH